jgi:arylsulfatase A-like enzyme
VLAISVDGLNVSAIDDVGGLARLLDEGAATLNARTEVEQTVTLPNHAGMLTGRRVDADQGGHGVTWNDEIPGRTVPGPDGDGVESVFDVVHDAGGSTALFAGKTKFATFDRSWPDAIDEFEIDEDADALVDDAIEDLTTQRRRFTFLHLALPDVAGHESGWLSRDYLAAVEDTDRLVDELLDTIDATPRLSKRLVVVLTADHGGPEGEKDHDDADDIANYRIPFMVWGRGVRPADLYELNPDFADPGTGQPSYDGTQPVRNGDLANLVTDLLGLGPVPGSELDAGQDLDWR